MKTSFRTPLATFLVPGLLALTLVLGACDSTGDDDDGDDEVRSVELSFSGLEALTDGFHYEGWAIVGGAPVTTGKFNVDGGGNLVDLSGAPIAGGRFETTTDLSGASAIVISIEPDGDTDTVPAATKYLGGDLSGGQAALSIAHPATLGDDFSGAAGSYILATPTTDATDDETSGLWFLDPTGTEMAPGLTLPTLPDGWRYEGWAVVNGTPITTGTFTDVRGADDAAPYSGPGAAPPFPGEDFVTGSPGGMSVPLDLAGATAVISVEPFPDASPSPFTLKPLVGMVPDDAASGTLYTMGVNTASAPTGTARLQ